MPHLIIVEPDQENRSVALTEHFRVGRHAQNDLVLRDARISRRHIRFERTPYGWEVLDNGSTSGMYINEERCGTGRLLVDGDVIRIGPVQLTFCEKDLA